MPSVERTITVDQPVERVWTYISDWTNTEEWDPPTVRTERTSGDGGVGTRYHNVSKFLGSEQEVDYEVKELVENQRMQLAGDAGSLTLLDTITLRPTASGTELTYHAEFTPHGAAKLAEPLMPAGLKLLADRVAESLEEHLRAL
ncbi:SRPBCC family protein [Nocardioides currus]|uniref:Polyketide cyclase n=1 Tax=Nocardioides currus TaxID=2133958 RepID=A0A2R7YUT7_9ACTN|nr:SRPBCC family protein [Nocardioides currus]PUA80135.1 polyketide cyclase [Nocardioides currus]